MKPSYTVTGADLAPPLPPPRDDLRLSNTTGILPKQKKKHETRLKNYVKGREIVVKMVVPLIGPVQTPNVS